MTHGGEPGHVTARSEPAPEARRVARGQGGSRTPVDGIANYFKFAERGTNLGRETKAGLTTFMVMAYILFLNPAILSNMFGRRARRRRRPSSRPLSAATALIAGILTLAMGIIANTPLAMAAGLGHQRRGRVRAGPDPGPDARRRDGRHRPRGHPRHGPRPRRPARVDHARRPAVAEAGDRRRHRPVHPVHRVHRRRGHRQDRRLSAENPVPTTFVYPTEPAHFVFWFGLLMTIALWARKVPGALLLSILITTIVAIADRRPADSRRRSPRRRTSRPSAQFDLTNVFTVLGALAAILTIFSFMLTDFFDTMGTATAISEQAGLVDEDGQPENVGRILLVDSVGAAARWRRGHQLEHELHRERGRRRRGRPDRLHLGRHRPALPGRHPAHAAGRPRPVRRHRPGPRVRRLPDGRAASRTSTSADSRTASRPCSG